MYIIFPVCVYIYIVRCHACVTFLNMLPLIYFSLSVENENAVKRSDRVQTRE